MFLLISDENGYVVLAECLQIVESRCELHLVLTPVVHVRVQLGRIGRRNHITVILEIVFSECVVHAHLLLAVVLVVKVCIPMEMLEEGDIDIPVSENLSVLRETAAGIHIPERVVGLRVLSVCLRTSVETERLGIRIDIRSHLLGIEGSERADIALVLVSVVAPDTAADLEPVSNHSIDIDPAEITLVTGIFNDSRVVDVGHGHVVSH